jgi:pimeloyl-ACP methyl ester carboxylesterase
MKKLLLFIHGLGGSAKGTWKQFPVLIGKDTDLADRYDVATFEYSTGGFGSKPSLAKVAAILKTELDNRYAAYSEIALIAHSQGGLAARYYIAERLNSGQPLRVSRLLTFATPHQGSGLATWLSRVPFASQQTEDLDPNSEFLQALAVAWGQAKPDLRGVLTKYVVAAEDAVVGQVSAMGPWSPGYEVVGGDGHLAVVKPETADDTSFLIAKRFLLEDGLKPGGVEPDYRAPLLRFNHVELQESTRFVYSARAIPLVGRETEKSLLADFLGNPTQPFRWMVMLGSGGVGKSRLALELCLAVRNEWHAGFLSRNEQQPDWGRWQPLVPTLIVVDYAARDIDRNGKLLQALAGRGPADGTLRLAAPVRVLFIERMGGDDHELMGGSSWLGEIMGFGTTEAQVRAARAPNLQLATLI